ncbi:hypothetical protein OIDMADRAFT_113386 [Oidiodendron maius Zn]|uniref:Uncharacterized protein n=1 Tax=Oidiodendron maius (strain Zn) TaxID=913774 RepID=A0A0C3D4C7_OIDMZ|nr:hypothetical protein OIDMADRAFT_113386 [Oidiodendron maius Zn]
MSSDLLAEFDSFYRAPQDAKSNLTPASNDLYILGGNTSTGKSEGQSGFPQWQSAQKSNNDIWGGMNSFQPASNPQPSAATQSDIWGSLGSLQQQKQPPPAGRNSGFGNAEFTMNNQRRNISQSNSGAMQRPSFDMLSSNIAPVSQSTLPNTSSATRLQLSQPSTTKNSSFGDILFDATEEQAPEVDDDDEFGEFETVTSEPLQTGPPIQSYGMFETAPIQSGTSVNQKDMSFLPANYGHGIMSFPPMSKPASLQQSTPFANADHATGRAPKPIQNEKPKSATSVAVRPDVEVKNSIPTTSQALSIQATEQVDDEWGDFSPETPATASAKVSFGVKTDAWAWDPMEKPTEPVRTLVDAAPPTNIPPPSVFLSMFPILFDLPQTKLFTPVAGQTFSLKNRILSDPSTIEFLRAYLLIATVAGRILAGRRLRWKRDTILAQSMRIGPATAGGKGGMKLTGVDKAEITREDREAAEVARVWKDQVGRLRSAVAVSNSSTQDSSRHLAIPDVSENIHVKIQQGAVTAPKPCLICGLKREERANKVDVDVEDSFGEWWVDHWGHRTCRNFWLENESKLKSR